MDRRVFLFVLFSMLLLVGGLSSGSASAEPSARPVPVPAWQDDILVPGTRFYGLGYPSLALDPDGNPHIVYGHNYLYHTWFDGVNWQREVIDRSRAWLRTAVIAINDAGTIFIAEINNEELFLRILEAGGEWQTTQAPVQKPIGLNIVLDSAGRPHIITGPGYDQQNQVISHSIYGPDGWSVEEIVAENLWHNFFSVDIDGNDQPVILYEVITLNDNPHEVWLVRREGRSWQNDLVGSGCLNSGMALAVDGENKAHVLLSKSCDGAQTYAREGGQAWELIPIPGAAVFPSLALDKDDRPHVVSNSSDGQIYATLQGDSWDTTIVQEGDDAGRCNTLLVDEKGAAHISSIEEFAIHYTTNENGQWQISTPAMAETIGWHNAMALDEADNAHILYYIEEATTLYWTTGSGSIWETELLATVPSYGLEIALDVDTQGRPHVAFINENKDELVAGSRQAGVWALDPIAGGGKQLSMAVDSMDRQHLAVIKNGVIYYWTGQEGEWTSEIVGEVDLWWGTALLALDSQDRPHIAYSDMYGSFLASRQGTDDWAKESLPFETVVKLVYGPDDRPYFLTSEERWEYDGRYPFLYLTLFYAERDGEEWSVKELWDSEYWDITADLAVVEKSVVHVTLRTIYGDHVYYQRDESGAWLMEYVAWPGEGDVSMTIAQDGQPRLLTNDGSSLILSTREIIWLDKFIFLPVLVP